MSNHITQESIDFNNQITKEREVYRFEIARLIEQVERLKTERQEIWNVARNFQAPSYDSIWFKYKTLSDYEAAKEGEV